VRPGDRVVVPALTFIATANAVRHAGAEPVFVDCDEFMNIDVEGVRSFLAEACEPAPGGWVERSSGAFVRAVLPVHVYGRPADLAALAPVAAGHGLAVIEDATEALGSRWTDGPYAGRSVGTVGQGSVFSFNGNKIATCGGGGVYVTPDAAAAARVRHLSTQAKTDTRRFVHDEVGWNYRLTNVAAAIGLAQLEQLAGFIAAKRACHELYTKLLADVPGIDLLGFQEGTEPNCWFHSVLVDETAFGRDGEGLMEAMAEHGIETRPVWSLLHEQAPFRECTAWRIERARWFWRRVLNVPCSSDLAPGDVERVVAAIRAAGRTA
jgi:perosamine synthetase